MAEYSTRSQTCHPIFGHPGFRPENQLPTKLAVYNHYIKIRIDCQNVGKSNVKADDIAK